MNSWLTDNSSGWTTRSARRSHQRLMTRLRRGIGAALVMAMAVLGLTVAPHASAADTAATITKTVVNQKASYAIGEVVTYRLTVSCSSLVGACGIGTLTDALDSNLTVTTASVFLPTTTQNGGTPPPMTKSMSGNVLTVTIGTAANPWMDGTSFDILVTGTVNAYPANSNPVGTIPNGATIGITNGAGDTAAPVVVNVTPPAKDWGIVKYDEGWQGDPAPGEVVSYMVRFYRPTNTGGIDIASAVLTDALDPRVEFVSSSYGTYDAATHTVSATVFSLPANGPMNCPSLSLMGGCDTYWGLQIKVRLPPNARNGTTPTAGTVFRNTINAQVTYADGSTGPLSDFVDIKTAEPIYREYAVKMGPTTTPPGSNITYRLYSQNTGNSTLTDYTVIDTLPLDAAGNPVLTNVYVARSGSGSPLPDDGAQVTLSWSTDGVTWTNSVLISQGADLPWEYFAPTGAKYVRFTFAALRSSETFDIQVVGTVPADTSLDASLENCASFDSANLDQKNSCVTTTIDPAIAKIVPFKSPMFNAAGQNSLVPGEIFDWILGFGVNSPLPLDSVTVSDVLPKEFELVGVTCFTRETNFSGIPNGVTSGPCPNFAIPAYTAVAQPDGSTKITFPAVPVVNNAEQNWYAYGIHLNVRVKPGTAIKEYPNEVLISTNSQVTSCDDSFAIIGTYQKPDADRKSVV